MPASPVAIVTGAGRGIGRATAIALAKSGHRILAVSRTESDLAETARLCAVSGACLSLRADIGQEEEIARVVEVAVSQLGRVDVMVHSAGAVYLEGIENLTAGQWREMVDVNLSAAVHFARRLWPIWRRQGGGVMVNVSSFSARDPFDGLAAYGAAKAGVNLLGLALAREGKAIGVRVHTVAPAATETTMLRSLFSPEQVPMEKSLDPAEVAGVILQCVTGVLKVTSGEVIYVQR